MRNMLSLAVVACALIHATAAQAAVTKLRATLSGANEVPANMSPGIGEAWVYHDDVADTLRIRISFSGLLGTTTASHIHCCTAPDGNAMVATTVPTFIGFPLGVSSGSYDETFSLQDISFYNPGFVTAHGGTLEQARADFLAGLYGRLSYVNVHSTAFPPGEIRGQLGVVPEPASWAMMIVGFGLLGVRMRRRRTVLAG